MTTQQRTPEDAVIAWSNRLFDLLREVGPHDPSEYAVFMCAFSHTLGVLVARSAEADQKPVGPMIKLVTQTVSSSARRYDRVRRSQMQ